jgi:pimeloyl-ACP methyl ester carboxylesterase
MKRWIPLQLTEKWIIQYPDYLNKFASIEYPPNNILNLQKKAMEPWLGSGVCDKLKDISKNTLVITGTGDRVIPPENSFVLTEKILGASLVQIEDGGHKLMSQYPHRFSSAVSTFLGN